MKPYQNHGHENEDKNIGIKEHLAYFSFGF
jgi:hypothetical protein